MERPASEQQLDFFKALTDGNPSCAERDGNPAEIGYFEARKLNEAIANRRREWLARQKRGTPASRAGRTEGGPSVGVCRMGEGGTHDLTRPHRCGPGLVDQVDDAKPVDVRVGFEEADGDIGHAVALMPKLGGLDREGDVRGHLRALPLLRSGGEMSAELVEPGFGERAKAGRAVANTRRHLSETKAHVTLGHCSDADGIDATLYRAVEKFPFQTDPFIQLTDAHAAHSGLPDSHLRAPSEYPATFSADEIHGLLACQKILRAMRAVCVQARREGFLENVARAPKLVRPRLLVDADVE